MQRILVALDGSPRAAGVLGAAERLVARTGGKLILYRAVGVPPDMPHELFEVTDQALEDVLLGNARAQLGQLVRDIPPDHIEEIVATLATAWDGICRMARERAVDLIVIGARGYGRLDRLLGTTASKVVNHADRDVLVVRSGAD